MTYSFSFYMVFHFMFVFNCAVFGQDQKIPLQEVTVSPQTLKSDNSTSELVSVAADLHNVTQFEKSADALPMPDNVTHIAELTSPTQLMTTTITYTNGSWPDYVKFCPTNIACDRLGPECIDCDFNETCFYGRNTSVICRPKDMIVCLGSQNFTRWHSCQFCYQTLPHLHFCTNSTMCKVISAPQQMYQANCTVNENVLCLGRRTFYKMLPCNWTSGKRWSTALILSITIGGFGADRFYLGLWREGIGKLFSFGGLGVWTLVDVVLVATGYIGPADGSLYIW